VKRYVEDVDGVLVPAPEPAGTTRSRDCYVVNAAPVAQVLHSFAREWNRLHPRDAALRDRVASRRPDVVPLSAVEWLAAESGIPQRTIEGFLRRDPEGRPSPKYPTTDLRIADALLTAAGRPDLLSDPPDPALGVRARGRRNSLTGTGSL